MKRLSIIVPVLNEAALVEAALKALAPARRGGAEVIVVDGGSTDNTQALARASGCADIVIEAPRGRAAQMNAGAAVAQGGVFLFLHVDTRLPQNGDRLTLDAVTGEAARCVWGRFDVRISGAHPLLALIAGMMNLRSRLSGIATGDQAMFMRRTAFERAGGFPVVALMEDIALSARLKHQSRPACIAARVTTSGRRWEAQGVVRTMLSMWWLRLRYCLGATPQRLAAGYRDVRDGAGRE